MKKLWDLIKQALTRHEHDIVEMPSAMGGKVLRACRTPGCRFMESVAVEPTAADLKLRQSVTGFQRGVLDSVAADLKRRPR